VTIEHACMEAVRNPGAASICGMEQVAQRWRARRRTLVSTPDINAPDPACSSNCCLRRSVVHPSSSGRRLRAIDRFGAWQDRGLVHPCRSARRKNRPRAEAAASRLANLRSSIEDDSIVDLVQMAPRLQGRRHFRPSRRDPRIGQGLVIAEIQQRSDATFRLSTISGSGNFMWTNRWRPRMRGRPNANRLRGAERRQNSARRQPAIRFWSGIDLPPNSNWELDAEHENLVLILEGCARIGLTNRSVGDRHLPGRGLRRHRSWNWKA